MSQYSTEYFNVPDDSQHKCGSCNAVTAGIDLLPIKDFSGRVTPGELCPSGECPHCNALGYPSDIPDKVTEAIESHKTYYGKRALHMAFEILTEESSELITAMCHHKRGRVGNPKVFEEMGDVMLLLELVTQLLDGEEEIRQVVIEKAARFSARVESWRNQIQ